MIIHCTQKLGWGDVHAIMRCFKKKGIVTRMPRQARIDAPGVLHHIIRPDCGRVLGQICG
jgi:hypothetical protein